MRKLRAVWELMRLEHGVMIALAILIGTVISFQGFPPVHIFVLTFGTALFLEASTFALNDYCDLEIDKHNKRRDRPLVRGDLSPKTALVLFAVLFPLGIVCSLLVNVTCFGIAVITGVLAVVYDVWLKRVKIVGNFYIAYTMAIPFVFGGAALFSWGLFSLRMAPGVYVVAVIAFLAGVGREIMKDVMDFAGDRVMGVKSFPRYVGVRGSQGVAAVFYVGAIVLSFVPFFVVAYELYYLDVVYVFCIVIADSLLLTTVVHLLVKSRVDFVFHRRLSLVALFVGLIGFLAGAFF